MPKQKTKKTILVVEDDALLRKILKIHIRENGYNVLEAGNGKEGLTMALKNHPDLILLDLMMPVMDGLEMLRELRKDEWGKGVFVYILTNKSPDDYLIEEAEQKPYLSSFLMKSEYGVDEILGLLKEKVG